MKDLLFAEAQTVIYPLRCGQEVVLQENQTSSASEY